MVLQGMVSIGLALCALAPGQAAFAAMHFGSVAEEETFLEVWIGGRKVKLEAFVAKPAASGRRFPVVLITHGKPAGRKRMAAVRANRYRPVAIDFARRGYLAVSVVRRGFGRSDGPFPAPLSCRSHSIGSRFESAADDLQAALTAVGGRPDADAGRVIVVGASSGGMAAMALAARNPPGLRAVLNFSGGLRFPNCPKEGQLVETMASLASRSRMPVLWLYAQNDSYFPPELVERMYRALPSGQSNIKQAHIGALRRDGHFLFSGSAGRMRWLRPVDAFLRSNGLPTWEEADVERLLGAAGLGPGYRAVVERYLAAPGDKALAWSPRLRRAAFYAANRSLRQARERAMRYCRETLAIDDCRIALENYARPSVANVGDSAAATAKPPRPAADMEPGAAGARETLRRRLGMSKRGEPFLERYLGRPHHKALARARNREYYSFMAGQPSLALARQRALQRCAGKAGGPCVIVMEGNRVSIR